MTDEENNSMPPLNADNQTRETVNETQAPTTNESVVLGDLALGQKATDLAQEAKPPQEVGWPEAISDEEFKKVPTYTGDVMGDLNKEHERLKRELNISNDEVRVFEDQWSEYGRIRRWLAATSNEDYSRAKRRQERDKSAYDRQVNEALTFRDKAHEEALEYVSGYESYIEAYDLLSKELAIEIPIPSMSEFIAKLDEYSSPKRRRESAADSLEVQATKLGVELALLDTFMPIGNEEDLRKRYYSESHYKYGSRELRHEISFSVEDAIKEAEQKGYKHFLQFDAKEYFVSYTIYDSSTALDTENIRYLPISDRINDLIARARPNLLDIVTKITQGGQYDVVRWIHRVDTSVLDLDELKQIEESNGKIPVLEYDLSDFTSSETEHVTVRLTGSIEAAQDKALRNVLDAEMNPSSPRSLVGKAFVRMPDGSKVSWEEFTAPALQRANSK